MIVIFHLRWALKASTTKSEGSSFCNSFKPFRRNKAEAAFGDVNHWRAQAVIVLLFRRCIGSHHHSWQYSITRGHHCTVNTLKGNSLKVLAVLSDKQRKQMKQRNFPQLSFYLRKETAMEMVHLFLIALPNHFFLPLSQHPLPYCNSFSVEDHVGLSGSLLISHRFLCGVFVKINATTLFKCHCWVWGTHFCRLKQTGPLPAHLHSCPAAKPFSMCLTLTRHLVPGDIKGTCTSASLMAKPQRCSKSLGLPGSHPQASPSYLMKNQHKHKPLCFPTQQIRLDNFNINNLFSNCYFYMWILLLLHVNHQIIRLQVLWHIS